MQGKTALLPTGGDISNEDDWYLLSGVGAELKIIRGLAARVEWEHLAASSGLGGFSLGMNYRF